MKKILKQWGEVLGVYFDKEDIKIYGLVKGDIIDISDMLVQEKTNKKEVNENVNKIHKKR